MRDYIIGSFNIQHLNNTKDFHMLAKIIKEEDFDIVAIQEVRRKHAIDEIVRELNSRYWDSAYTSGNEEYAFIWKKRRLKKLELRGNKENPAIVNNFHYKKSDETTTEIILSIYTQEAQKCSKQ